MSEAEQGSGAASPGEPAPAADAGRRRFLELAALGLGAGCALAGAGVVATAVVGGPLLAEGAGGEQWLDLGPLARFPEGVPVKVGAVGERRDAWNRFPARTLGNVIVVRQGQEARILSAVCPHNGCEVQVQAGRLLCPCHDSWFAADGAVETGPSPRALDPLEARRDERHLWVRFQRFQVGTAERRPL